jgi:ABC-type uncharacterized transport system permease subunit
MRATVLHLITGVLYLSLAAWAWHGLLPVRRGLAEALPLGNIRNLRLGIGAVLALHAVTLAVAIHDPRGLDFGFAVAASIVAWLTLAIYTFSALFDPRLTTLQMMMLPFAGAAVLLALGPFSPRILPYGREPFFPLHLTATLLAYSLFVVALLHACLMIYAQRGLHRGNVPWPLRLLPPLMQMERVLFRVLLAAFTLLTVALLVGALFSQELFGMPFRINNHKNVFAVASWAIFAGLLLVHHIAGIRGRIAARWTIAGFVFLLLSYFGSKFVLEVLLGRA